VLAGSAMLTTVPGRSAHPQFLEKLKQPSAQFIVNEVRDFVGQFPADLTRPQAARRIHSFLSDVTPRLLRTKAFTDEPAEDPTEAAMEGLEKFVVLKLYKLLFRHAPVDVREDEHAEQCIRKAVDVPLPSELSGDSRALFQAASAQLQKVDEYRAPKDKSVCMINAYRIVEGIVVEDAYRKGDTQAVEGILHRILAALVAKACPQNCFSNFAFTAAFRHPSRTSHEERRCFRQFSAALSSLTGPSAGQKAAEANPADADVGRTPWLVDAGVTFHFEGTSDVGALKVGEVEDDACST